MRGKILLVSILGLSLILASVVFGAFFYKSRQTEKSISVVGSTTQRYESDIVKWRITLSRTTGPDNIKDGYTQLKTDLQTVTDLLVTEGIPVKDITVQPINTEQTFNQNATLTGYRVYQSLNVISGDVSKVESIALNPELFVAKGVLPQSSSLEYYFSKLSEIKKALLAKATLDAKYRAVEIAKSTGDRIDKIQSARAGVFQITEPYSTDVNDYGIYNTASREKDITVTVNAAFTMR